MTIKSVIFLQFSKSIFRMKIIGTEYVMVSTLDFFDGSEESSNHHLVIGNMKPEKCYRIHESSANKGKLQDFVYDYGGKPEVQSCKFVSQLKGIYCKYMYVVCLLYTSRCV